MRICVYGAGAVGGHLAAKLGAAGHEVSVVARGAQLAALREKGVTLLHGEERITARVKAAEDPAALGTQDLVIVTLKANGLASLSRNLGSLLKSATPVVFAQNGIPWWYGMGLAASRPKSPDLSRLDPGGALRQAIPQERIIGAVIYSANDVVEPGVVMNHTAGNNMLVIGNCDDRESAEVQDLRRVLEKANLSSPPAPDIRQVIWAKLVMNMSTGTLCLLTGGTVADVRGDPATAKIVEQVLAEARAIAKAHGVDAAQAPKRPSGGHSSGQIAHKPSILQDYERGRPMEIEAQLATPLAFARAAGVVTPTLDM